MQNNRRVVKQDLILIFDKHLQTAVWFSLVWLSFSDCQNLRKKQNMAVYIIKSIYEQSTIKKESLLSGNIYPETVPLFLYLRSHPRSTKDCILGLTLTLVPTPMAINLNIIIYVFKWLISVLISYMLMFSWSLSHSIPSPSHSLHYCTSGFICWVFIFAIICD